MTYTFQPRGVCSRAMKVEVDDQGVIQDLQVLGGCNGNLQGISALVKGMKAEEAIARLKGISCGGRGNLLPGSVCPGSGSGSETSGTAVNSWISENPRSGMTCSGDLTL